jgi:hypothetical protein
MYDSLYDYMDTDIFGATDPSWYGPGFVEMALHYGYDNFSYAPYGPDESDVGPVDGDFYDDVIKEAIDNGWPVALAAMGALIGFSDVEALPGSTEQEHSWCCPWPCTKRHWIAIKGYFNNYWDGYTWHARVVICTDSYSGCNDLYLDWDKIVEEVGAVEVNLQAIIIKDVDDPELTPLGTVEDFEWGNDGDSPEAWQGRGGEVDWEVSTSGASVVEINTVSQHPGGAGTRSARFYKNSYHSLSAHYSLIQPSYIGFWVKKDNTGYAEFRIGDGNNAIFVRINSSEVLQYSYDILARKVCQLQANTWYLIEFKNINWTAATPTYDIYVNGYRPSAGTGVKMRPISGYNGLYFGSWTGSGGTFWIDDITDSLRD